MGDINGWWLPVASILGGAITSIISLLIKWYPVKTKAKMDQHAQVISEYQQLLVNHQLQITNLTGIVTNQQIDYNKKISDLSVEHNAKISSLQIEHNKCQAENQLMQKSLFEIQSRLDYFQELYDREGPPRVDAVIIGDHNGIILEWNPAATLLLHWTATDIVGKSIIILIPDRLINQHLQSFKYIMEMNKSTRNSPIKTFAITQHGQEIPITLTLTDWINKDGNRLFSATIHKRFDVIST